MRWLCFLLLANPYPLAAQASPKPLRFDLEGLTAKRDSFVFFLRGAERGYAVWQYEIRPLEMTQRLATPAYSEFGDSIGCSASSRKRRSRSRSRRAGSTCCRS